MSILNLVISYILNTWSNKSKNFLYFQGECLTRLALETERDRNSCSNDFFFFGGVFEEGKGRKKERTLDRKVGSSGDKFS